MVTKAQIKATTKFEHNNYDKILLRIRKDVDKTKEPTKAMILKAAEAQGMSINAYLYEAVAEKLKRDGYLKQSGGTEYENQPEGPVIHTSVYPKE